MLAVNYPRRTARWVTHIPRKTPYARPAERGVGGDFAAFAMTFIRRGRLRKTVVPERRDPLNRPKHTFDADTLIAIATWCIVKIALEQSVRRVTGFVRPATGD